MPQSQPQFYLHRKRLRLLESKRGATRERTSTTKIILGCRNSEGIFKMLEVNKIYNADCLELMKQLPDECIDLVLTDPPYGINIAKNGKVGGGNLAPVKDYGAKSWDKFIPNDLYFKEILRVSKNQIIFGGNYFVECLFNT